MLSHTFRFPEQCSVCLGAPETTYRLSRSQTIGAQTTTYSLEVPICHACAAKQKKKELLTAIAMIGFAGLIGMLIGMGSRDIGALGGIFIGGVLGAVVYGFSQNYFLQPAQIEKNGNGIFFRNNQYDKLFRGKNNYVPRTYY